MGDPLDPPDMDLLVYGSYGYTGRLVVDEALDRDLDPVLAGRDAAALESQAADTDLDYRAFDLDGADAVAEHVEGFDAVLNCAGPFVHTAEPMVEACISAGTDYCDITGEVEVFEALAERDDDAERAGVTLLPGVGFDVVPSDCLAAHLAEELPEATHLRMGYDGLQSVSRGTALSMIERLGDGGLVREDGDLRQVSSAYRTRDVDFDGDGRASSAVTIPWGDVVTAYHTTGVPNVEFYAGFPPAMIRTMKLTSGAEWLFGTPPVKTALKAAVRTLVDGPDDEELEREEIHLWGEITDGEETLVARMTTPNGYALTADTAVESATRLPDADAGFRTPAGEWGADYALDFDGVSRTDAHPE